MLMCILSLFILSGHCMLSGCNASIIDFLLISEVPSDSLFLKQFDSVSGSGESVQSVLIRT